MSNDLETRPEASVVALAGGILTDVQSLIKQQLALFQYEIKGEVSHALEASFLVAIGLSVVVMGGVLLGGMLVHFLSWIAPALPLWGSYGIVGIPVAGLGAILCLVGIRKFKDSDIPSVETTGAMGVFDEAPARIKNSATPSVETAQELKEKV